MNAVLYAEADESVSESFSRLTDFTATAAVLHSHHLRATSVCQPAAAPCTNKTRSSNNTVYLNIYAKKKRKKEKTVFTLVYAHIRANAVSPSRFHCRHSFSSGRGLLYLGDRTGQLKSRI